MSVGKITKGIISFIVFFTIAYLITGYVMNNTFAHIHWIEEATIIDKLKEYYIRTFSVNIIPAFVLAIIPTAIVIYKNRRG